MQKKTNKKSSISTSIAVKPAMRLFLNALVLIISFLFFAKKIVFVNADLGRHLKNGEVILNTGKVISTNYYSFTESDFPVINHHWGSGVLFYLIQKMFGFSGLSFIYCLLSAITVFLFYKIAESKSHTYFAFLFFMLCIPLITITKGESDSIKLLIYSEARGSSFKQATINAQNIKYNYTKTDSSLILNPFFTVDKYDKWRMQRVRILLKIPEGEKVIINKRLYYYINNSFDDNMFGKRLIMREGDFIEEQNNN